MGNGRITAQGTYDELLAEGIDFHAALHDDTGAATPSPGVTPTHMDRLRRPPRSHHQASPPKVAEAALEPLMAVSQPGTPASNGAADAEEYSDVTALLLDDSAAYRKWVSSDTCGEHRSSYLRSSS